MKYLFNPADADILREATNATTVFLYRARHAPLLVAGGLGATAIVALIVILLILGPEGSGIPFATRDSLAILISIVGLLWAGYLGYLFFQFLPSRNDRIVMRRRAIVRAQIDPLEERITSLTDEQLKAKRAEFTERLARGESIDDIRPEAYAVVREASRRFRNHRQFECQLIGGQVIEDCAVAEMRTGEGKTIVCYMALYMKVLQGLRVHMVTVNDYLVKRDAGFCGAIFEPLGVSVGFISSDMGTYGPEAEPRRAAYQCDITYGTNSEFGFDYLRDNMKHHVRDQVQGPQDYVVVDEVDSILIDEARTPLIISGPAHDDVNKYRQADNIARMLIAEQETANRQFSTQIDQIEANAPRDVRDDAKFRSGMRKFRTDPLWLTSEEAEIIGHKQYFVVELDRKSAHMTDHGARLAQSRLGIGTFYDSQNMNWPHHIDNALRAHLVYQKDKEYVIHDGTITIVDEFTGRLMHGRQWSDGLHQAVEAKEKVTIKQESQTFATITLQNLFKLYRQLAGMTGTAMTEADEFMKIYKLDVVAIPTNRPIRRVDYNDRIYKSTASKYNAIVEEIRSYGQFGYPTDPWSLEDMFRMARKALNRAKREKLGDADDDAQLAAVDAALAAFKQGDGNVKALEDAYLQLVGGEPGGRPVLVGTTSVENSEKLSDMLTRRYGIEHEVLNAKNHAREAEIVAKAGQRQEVVRAKKKILQGNVTIATNMAGRGTDIVLGPGVAHAGGLHVVGTERHESRRIDNQLRGRCGRQGDPGSSRFFLSFEDELLRTFMPDWILKQLERLHALEEDVPVESGQLNKGIARAQRKVEERNFNIRKNLLEYDEVPDQQRKQFYTMRQRVVEGRELSDLIWEMIDETVSDAIDRYYDPKYAALCVAEWVGQNLGVQVDANRLDTGDFESLKDDVRTLAVNELRSTIARVFGEYIDPDIDPEEWDVRGLASWASQYGLSLTQRQIREGDPDELSEQLQAAAIAQVEAKDLDPLEPFLDSLFARSRLSNWTHEKFGVGVPLDDLSSANRDEAERIIREKMRAAYRQREIEYPVAAVISYAASAAGTNVNQFYALLANWANFKYRLDWNFEHLAGKDHQQLFAELRAINEDYLSNGRMRREIDSSIQGKSAEQIEAWAKERFGRVLEYVEIDPDGEDVSAQLDRAAYELLRYELTQLERMVLLQTFDAVWKDHMYSMDLLRHSIGLRGYAERDPKIEFKREGTRLMNETLANIRERVTDVIFKVQVVPPSIGGGEADEAGGASASSASSPPQNLTATKADATNAGYSEATRDQQAALGRQGEGARPQTIRRDQPKVGRNDPCPCGSGKKYKQCHGRGA